MLFTQLEFPIFLLITLTLVWAFNRRTPRNVILLFGSYYFYAYWDVRFCSLLLISTFVDYGAAQLIDHSKSPWVRRVGLCGSLACNLGMLAYFKYAGFFVDSARAVFDDFGLSSQTLGIILPVGISFYTFQTLSYTIDVYRGRLKPIRSLLDFALYVAFFPQLVAGPIVRARELLPQLATVPRFSRRRFYAGFQQLLRGAVMKVLIADRLGEMVDVVFAGPTVYSGFTLWIAAVAYAGQIYCDFAGYSNMAIGVAKLLGYRFPKNFRHPYLSRSMSEFWSRWHMTLSRWLRDYLYISLGGNRRGRWAEYRNLMIAMVLGGLWHGAAWTFVLWGFWHGLALCLQRAMRWRPKPIVAWAGTMAVVLVGWILFRSPSLGDASLFLTRMLFLAPGVVWLPPLPILAILLLVAEHTVWTTKYRRTLHLPIDCWYSPVVTTILLWCLVLYAPQGFRPFVYFQF